jgi:AcrR family transcriptional regulator
MTELRGQAQRGARSRKAIVDAALDVFAVRGFRAGALGEIADKVGLSPAGILYHFGSKEALLVDVIAERDRRAGDLITGLTARGAEGGLAALHELERIAELCESEPGLAALHTVLQIESVDAEAPAHDYFAARSRFVREAMEQFLAECQARHEVAPDVDCAAKAREIIAFLEGAAVLWLVDRSVSLVDLYRNYITTFVTTITPPSPEPTA